MPARNVADDPRRRFEIDPSVLFPAIRAARSGGPAIAGYYHSHPTGRAEPSGTDNAMRAPDGKLWLILAGDVMTAWISRENGFDHVDIVET
jgi:proteasome lid subunit RPN8/RPN11